MDDYINTPVQKLIDCRTEEGIKLYKNLFIRKKTRRKVQKSVQYSNTRQTKLDEFFPLSCKLIKFYLVPAAEHPICLEGDQDRAPLPLPKREMLIKCIKEIKAVHQTYGRSRIKKELPENLECSESTISRILRNQQLQNPPKRLASEVKIGIWCPSLASYTGESFSLECDVKNSMILIVLLFQRILEPLISPFLTKKEVEHVLAYSLGMLFEKPVYQCLEAIPLRIMELLGFDKKIKVANIAGILRTLGSYKEPVSLEKINGCNPEKLAMDEKVIERYSKKPHIETHDENCQMGYIYCSRRNKGVLAESIEVIADITQEGIALPLYFMFTPHSLSKKEQAKIAELKREITQQTEYVHPTTDTKDDLNPSSCTKGKRTDTVFLLLDIISSNMGRLPLRFDNNYAQQESINRLQREEWGFIGHGRSNLKIAKELKKRMKKEQLIYDYEKIDSPDHERPIHVVGYQKSGRIHIYLTNETNHESAKAIIEEYRDRWRLENTFKWVNPLTLLSGSDPLVHLGQLIISFYFFAYLVHYFRAATPTLISLFERPASVYYENNVLVISFPKLRKYYWEKLLNLQRKLRESQFSLIQISYDYK
jgi:hypothetical protein